MSLKIVRFIVTTALCLALFVVMLGAYTRLTGAGLGCPDWPGCYGKLLWPMAKQTITAHSLSQLPYVLQKAWTEMAHRYAAGTLALLIVVIAGSVAWLRQRGERLPWRMPGFLVLLVVFQAALGMWTVTLKLLPVVVMSHLLGGVFIFVSLCYFRLQLSSVVGMNLPNWRFWIGLGVVLVFCQIALGGWVSSNYAGIACIGFPRCNGVWFPTLHLYQGFYLFSPVGANYQGGILDTDVRVTIQFIHRLGGFSVLFYVLILSGLLLWRTQNTVIKISAILASVLVLLQFTLGVVNVLYLLPLWVAVLHNGVAALLMASMVMMRYLATGGEADVR